MSAADTGSSNPGLGWWAKLVLWTLVLVFGVLYLGSVKHNPRVVSPTPVTTPVVGSVPAASPSAGAAASNPGVGHSESTADSISAPVGDQADRTQGSAEAPEPVSAAESAAFADSLLNKESAEEVSAESTESVAASPSEGSSTTATPLPETSAGRTGGAAQEVPAGTGGSAPQAQTPRTQPAPVGRTSGQELDSGSGMPETQEAERARILMEYRSLQRAAEEQMRQYRRQMGMPPPAGLPYGYPGYGHHPWVYPSR